MREGWKRAELGEVFARSNRRVGDYEDEPEVFSVTKHDGIVPALEYFGKRVASEALHNYKTVGTDEWAYSTIHIDEGSIARNTLGRPGVVSPMYTTMRVVTEDVDPGYLELLLRSPQMLALYGDTQQGSVDRRKSLSWKVFSQIQVPLPPLTEQRRIADVVAMSAEVLANARGMHRQSEEVVKTLREELLQGDEIWTVGELLTSIRKPVDVDLAASYTEIGVRSHGRGYFTKDSVTGEELGKKKVFWVQPGALAFNIVFAWEGAVVVLDDGVDGLIASHRFPNFTSQWDSGVPLLSNFFQTARGRALLVDCSPGGAGRNKTLNMGRLMDSVIRLPKMNRWSAIVDRLSEAKERTAAAERYVQTITDLRANLLAALLSGEHKIPESYNELLEEPVT